MLIGSRTVSRAAFSLYFVLAQSCASQFSQANTSEESVGRASVASILGAASLHSSNELQRYVNLVGGQIASKTDAKQNWRFGVLETESVNAFAAPGGFVLVTTGLLRLLDNEDELAGVLAHEIAHVTRQHHYQAVIRQRNAEAAMKGLQDDLGKDAAEFATLTRASAVLYARGLDKNLEYEADMIGVQLMTIAGYDPSAHLSVLEKLHIAGSNDSRMTLLVSTHPSARERIDYLIAAGVERLPIPRRNVAPSQSRFNKYVRDGVRK